MRPPRLARYLLRAASPLPIRDEVVGELDAEFREHVVPARNRTSAALWYWHQVLSSLPRLMFLRRVSIRRSSAPWMRDVAGDLQYGLRQFRHTPLSTGAAVLTLALGIGATTAIFAAAYPVLLRPLPYAQPDRLVHLFEWQPDNEGRQASFPDYFDWRSARSFEHMAGYSGGTMAMTTHAGVERVRTLVVTDEFLEVLGVPPAQGRDFSQDDFKDGAPRVLILTHGLWQRRFGGASIVGNLIPLNGAPTQVIGVLPERFEFALRGDAELLVPYVPSPWLAQRRYTHSVDVIARLASDVNLDEARAELATIGGRIAREDERYHRDSTVIAVPLAEEMIGTFDRLFAALGISAGLVFVMACANVGMLVLLRMQGRARELSVRSALGASRRRLLRQLLAESLLLAMASGVLALFIARWAVTAATRAVPARQAARMPGFREMGLSVEVMAFVVVLVTLIGIVLTLTAGWRHVAAPAQVGLREDGRTSSAAPARKRATSIFVAAQVALAMTVLASAALLVQSVRRLIAVSPGFAVENLLTFRLSLTTDHYPTPESALAAHDRFLQRLSAIPGVMSAGTITNLPLTGPSPTGTITIVGRPSFGSADPSAAVRTVSPSYFRTMGIPLVAGRELTAADTASSTRVVLVNRALADGLFEGKAIGERIIFPFTPEPWEIVGVVGNENFEGLDRPIMRAVYFAPAQQPSRGFSVVLRTALDAESLADDVAAAVASINPRLPVYDVLTMEQLRASSGPVWMRRYVLWLVGVFAALALVLSAIGVYGVVGQSVADRRREFGIRLALGATRREVMSTVVRQGAVPVIAGLAAGLAGATLVRQQLESFLFRSQLSDAAVVAGAAAALAALALVACIIPSRRAANTDPAITLRG